MLMNACEIQDFVLECPKNIIFALVCREGDENYFDCSSGSGWRDWS